MRCQLLKAGCFALSILFYSNCATASELSLTGGSVPFKAQLPQGYCALSSQRKADAGFYEYLKRAAGKSIKILGAVAPCVELSSFREGGKKIPKRFAAIAQVGVDGGFGRFLLGRRVFNALITSFTPGDLTRTQDRASRRLSDYGDSVGDLKVKILGIAQKSTWFEGQGVITHNSGSSDRLRLVGGSTLVSKYPVTAFYVTSGSDSLEEALKSVAMPLLDSVDVNAE